MSFLKNMLSEFVGDKAAEVITSATKTITKKTGVKAAQGAMNAVAEKASERAVKSAIDKAASALGHRPSLETPPPPAVPKFESMSVMVAVNGETYGPYEKNTLVEMIGNGSLTQDTYVFIEGMTEWKKAGEVEQVAGLFGQRAPLPPAPPQPWANSQNMDKDSSNSDNTLSARLNKLIDAAIADGEISDLERQVLIRNAQEEGVAMDEFVMVLEARLYEQRKKLTQHEEEKRQRAEALKVQQQAVQNNRQATSMRTENKPATKCPHCGAPIKALASCCPECGHDYIGVENGSAWEKMSAKIHEIQQKEEPKRSFWDTNYLTKTEQIVNVINACSVPTNKKEIVEFFTQCAPLGVKKGIFSDASRDEIELSKAYRAKAQQVLLKARIVLKDDTDLLAKMEEIAKQYKIKV